MMTHRNNRYVVPLPPKTVGPISIEEFYTDHFDPVTKEVFCSTDAILSARKWILVRSHTYLLRSLSCFCCCCFISSFLCSFFFFGKILRERKTLDRQVLRLWTEHLMRARTLPSFLPPPPPLSSSSSYFLHVKHQPTSVLTWNSDDSYNYLRQT